MEKVHIVITGRRNTGKSSLINCITGQEKAIVSEVAGTTTDPVKKSYELPGIASIVFIDTAGTDDEGNLGKQRIAKTFEAIRQADAAILVINNDHVGSCEEELIREFHRWELPFLILRNKTDLIGSGDKFRKETEEKYSAPLLPFSTLQPDLPLLISAISQLIRQPAEPSLLEDIVCIGQCILLVTPVDAGAPTGRLILPQVQTLRDILDRHAVGIVLQPEEIENFLQHTSRLPDLVITDSQVFGKVDSLIPASLPLTSFSILFARRKGYFEEYLAGTPQIDNLREGDRILLLESCTHHASCEDIGRVKIPALLQKYSGKPLEFDFIGGLSQIKRPLSEYALIIQCGGCMLTSRQLRNRLKPAIAAGIPVSNYGMVLAWINGIFRRATEPLRKK